MSNTDETLEQPTQNDGVLQAINELTELVNRQFASVNLRFESIEAQLENVRQGIVHNGVAFDRLKADVLNLRADVKELTEEIKHKVPV